MGYPALPGKLILCKISWEGVEGMGKHGKQGTKIQGSLTIKYNNKNNNNNKTLQL